MFGSSADVPEVVWALSASWVVKAPASVLAGWRDVSGRVDGERRGGVG